MQKKLLFILTVLSVLVTSAAMILSLVKTKKDKDLRASVAKVVVFASTSFVDSYGPGPELKAEFEKKCDCVIEYHDVGSLTALMEKHKLDGSRRIDLLLGIDHLQLEKLNNVMRMQSLSGPSIVWRPEIKPYVYGKYLPYNWSPMGIVYRKSKTNPAGSFAQLVQTLPNKSLALQDPRLSTPGLEFLYWIFATQGDYAQTFKSLQSIVHSYSPSWSAAYGLFKNGKAQATFSYLTSLVYHWEVEKDFDYQFMSFAEGHPLQLEYAAVPDSCLNCGSAKQFLNFMLSEKGQEIIANKNFMLPVRENMKLNASFEKLPQVKLIDAGWVQKFVDRQDDVFNSWSAHR